MTKEELKKYPEKVQKLLRILLKSRLTKTNK